MRRLLPLVISLIAAAPSWSQAPERAASADAQRLEDLAGAAREALEALGAAIAPWVEQLGRLIDDPGAYEPPEILPNGDILIRRKPDAPPRAAPGLDL